MQCSSYDAGACASCTLIEEPYPQQVEGKERRARGLLADHPAAEWLPPVTSVEQGFRTRAKMVVGGTARRPTLGILDGRGQGVDLRDCRLHTPGIVAALPVLADFVARAGLTPYDVPRRRGELKHVLVTEAPSGDLMVRFVLRSEGPVATVRRNLPWLLEALPRAVVVTANLHPEHKAVLEGDTEVVLTAEQTLRVRLGDVDLRVRPQGFLQTNAAVASALYRQVRDWVDDLAPTTVWDLYCGVGGFTLHCAAPGRQVTGVETSAEAVEAARATAAEAGLPGVTFVAGDAARFARDAAAVPDVVVVNPPRRGLGPELAGWLEGANVTHVVYSSCNAASLARDLAAMPSLRPVQVRLLDMFPQSSHFEVVTLLRRSA